jgi:hypothetical protein
VHWLQIIATNAPDPNYPHGTAQNGSGLTYYVDDGPVANPTASGPWYDLTGAANSTDFFDAPARTYANNTTWMGMVFIGTWDPANGTIDISNQAVVWGFKDPLIPAATVPEPNSLLVWSAMLLLFLGFCLGCSRARRHLLLARCHLFGTLQLSENAFSASPNLTLTEPEGAGP